MYDFDLDTRGLSCPLPVAKVKQKMKVMSSNEQLLVISSDPVSIIDFPTYAKISKNKIIKSWQNKEEYYFVFQKL